MCRLRGLSGKGFAQEHTGDAHGSDTAAVDRKLGRIRVRSPGPDRMRRPRVRPWLVLLRLLGAAEQAVDLVLTQRLRIAVLAHELDHALDAADGVQRFLPDDHLDEDVAREDLALDGDLLAILDFHRLLGRHEGLPDEALLRRRRIAVDLALQQVPDLVLVAGGRLHGVEVMRHVNHRRAPGSSAPGGSGRADP